MSQRVLGIETSCDETGIALYDADRGLLGHRLFSQVALHAPYGGVVPELASRDHLRRILPLTRELLSDCLPDDKWSISGIAYTAGPGLVGALLTGATVARAMAMALGLPALGVHHMEGHLLAPRLEEDGPEFPFLALLVSGGHSLLVAVRGLGRYRVLGQTLDDAAGQAFDKTAKLLGLGYPGGPLIERLAAEGDPASVAFPRPMTRRPGLDFSFSGLKTAVYYARQRQQAGELAATDADLAASFQAAILDTLAIKCRRALAETGLTRLVIAGGCGANRALRARLAEVAADEGARVYYPRAEFCTDNGAMIAYAGFLRLAAGETSQSGVRARWSLEDLRPPRAAETKTTGTRSA